MTSNNLPMKLCLAGGFTGIALASVGVITAQSQLEYSLTNIMGLSWYIIFYAALLYGGIFFAFITNNIKTYRLAIVGFMAAYLGMVPNVLESRIFVANILAVYNGTFTIGSSFFIAGILLVIFPLFVLMLVLGSESDSKANLIFKMVPSKDGAKIITLSKKQAGTGKNSTANSPDSNSVSIAIPSNLNDSISTMDTTLLPFPRMVCALYTFEGDEAHPDVVSFENGEMLQVNEKRGNWALVTKFNPDGTTMDGIAPFNFFRED